MTLEGNSSHLRLAGERNFPFNTGHLHLLQLQPALRPGTESNRPQGKPDTSMLHPQIPLGDRAAHTGGDQITSHPSSPRHKTHYLRTSAMLIGTWMLQEQPPKSAKRWCPQPPALWTQSLWVNPLLEKKETKLRVGRSYHQKLDWAERKPMRPLGGINPGPTQIKGKKSS